MTPLEKSFHLLRNVHIAGCSIPLYCSILGYKKVLIAVRGEDEKELVGIAIQFHLFKGPIAEFRFIDENTRDVRIDAPFSLGSIRVSTLNPKEQLNGYDWIIVMSDEKIDFLPARKTIYINRFVAEMFRYTYCERPLLNFVKLNPGVKVVVMNYPILVIGENSTEREKEISGISIHSVRNELVKNAETGGKPIETPLDDLGYTNDEVMRLLTLTGAATNPDGSTTLVDTDDDLLGIFGGKRKTVPTDMKIKNVIHCVGTCVLVGMGAPWDKTFESYLQRILEQNGEPYAVVNESQYLVHRYQDIFYNLNSLDVQEGDIVLICVQGLMTQFLPQFNVHKIFNRPHNYGEVFIDKTHNNERGYKALAENFYDFMVENRFFDNWDFNVPGIQAPHLYGIPEWANSLATARAAADLPELSEYIKQLKRLRPAVGAIVMNCNPFTLGHRYLIEHAAGKVCKLFIFAVEEDRSVFPFADRFELIKQGTADLPNVTVLPSGKFIISSLTFNDYFNKAEIQDRKIDPSQDVTIFARHIAPALGITIRFAGEEPLDKVTLQYNQAMARILPKHGIDFEVIKRKESGGAVISASRVRSLLNDANFDEIKKIVPQTTFDYLAGKFGSTLGGGAPSALNYGVFT